MHVKVFVYFLLIFTFDAAIISRNGFTVDDNRDILYIHAVNTLVVDQDRTF